MGGWARMKKVQNWHLLWFENYKPETFSGIKIPFQKPKALAELPGLEKIRTLVNHHLVQDPVTLPPPLEHNRNVRPFILGTVRKTRCDENIHTSPSPPSLCSEEGWL